MGKFNSRKPLKGISANSERGGQLQVESIEARNISVGNVNVSEILDGSFVFDPIDINSGTIDGTLIGGENPGPATFTSLQTGNSTGVGADVVFYGNTVGDFAQWVASGSRFLVNGSVQIRDNLTVGDLEFTENTIKSFGGKDIILDPSGSGCVVIDAECFSVSDKISLTDQGDYRVSVDGYIQTNSLSTIIDSKTNQEYTTRSGDLAFSTESFFENCITTITTTPSVITTKFKHSFSVGQEFKRLTDGVLYTISELISDYSFKVSDSLDLQEGDAIARIIEITSINSFGSANTAVLTTKESHYLLKDSVITISASNSTPSIDGEWVIANVVSDIEFTIIGVEITSSGSFARIVKSLDSAITIKSREINLTCNSLTLNKTCQNENEGVADFSIYNSNIRIKNDFLEIGDGVSGGGDGLVGVKLNFLDTSSPVGFFGLNETTGCFTFYQNFDTKELGCLTVGDITADSLSLQQGLVVSEVSSNKLTGDPDLMLEASRDIILNAGSSVNIPIDIPIEFGGAADFIKKESGGLTIKSSSNIDFLPGNPGDLRTVPGNKFIFDLESGGGGGNFITSVGGELLINSSSLIKLNSDLNLSGNTINSATWNGSTISVDYGGTGKTEWTQGSVVFAGQDVLEEDNANFFWDNLLNRLFVSELNVSSLAPGGSIVFTDADKNLITQQNLLFDTQTSTLTTTIVKADNLVEKEDFGSDNTILKADLANQPISLEVGEDTLIGRVAGSGIDTLSATQVNNILRKASFQRLTFKVVSQISSTLTTSPSSVEITTSNPNGLSAGDVVVISGTDNNLDGTFTVDSLVNSNTFSITTSNEISSSASTGTVSPDNPVIDEAIPFTMIIVAGVGNVNTTLGGALDGQVKNIVLSAMEPGSVFKVNIKLIDPGSSTNTVKEMEFESPGQSSQLVYDQVLDCWFIVNSGAVLN